MFWLPLQLSSETFLHLEIIQGDIKMILLRWCLHLNVVGEFASFCNPESYAGGSVATGRLTQAGQVKG
jgi:hypothetical protein